MAASRNGQTATLLDDGKVLITGGIGSSGYLTSAELYIGPVLKAQTSSPYRDKTRADVASATALSIH
jgi:hypothetical protein